MSILLTLNKVFKIVKENNLRVKPSKTYIRFPEMNFLDHKVGNEVLKPMEEMLKNFILK